MLIGPAGQNLRRGPRCDAEVYHAAGAIMAERGLLCGVADEGGWWPAFSTNEEALETLMRAIERAGFAPGEDVAISLDVAASEFGQGGRYRLGLRTARARPRRNGRNAPPLVRALSEGTVH